MIVTDFRARLRDQGSAAYESLRGLATQADHATARREGRASFYQEYSIQVCELLRASTCWRPG